MQSVHSTPRMLPCVLLLAAACQSYEPAPVDLAAHELSFLRREPPRAASGALTRRSARATARLFHPDARLARRDTGVATALRDFAGLLPDPQLSVTPQYVLEQVAHRWVVQSQLGVTLPINGRLGAARTLAERERAEAIATAWTTEQRVANELDRAWIEWTAATRRVLLLDAVCDDLTELQRIADRLVAADSLTRPAARVFALERRNKEIARERAAAAVAAAALHVKQRLGLHPDAPVALAPELDVEPFLADADARRDAVHDSPQLLRLRLAHRSAEADLDLQVRMQWPDLQLWPGHQQEDGAQRAQLGFQFNLPIFNANAQAIAEARAVRERTAEALRCGLEALLQALAIAEIDFAASTRQARRFAELRELAEQQVRDGELLAKAGQFDPMLLLDALLRLYGVKLQELDAREAAAHAAVTINDLLAAPDAAPLRFDAEAPRGDDR
ncbi:MAG: TolC family protein [Planctomycetes bacterium]|nr:TolC family protein [Planctomycetota bacterium]